MSVAQIASTIIIIFVIIGGILPFVREEFEGDSTDTGINIEDELGGSIDSESSISAFTVLGSILSMFFWTFGALPFWLDTIFLAVRIILVLLIAMIVRGVS